MKACWALLLYSVTALSAEPSFPCDASKLKTTPLPKFPALWAQNQEAFTGEVAGRLVVMSAGPKGLSGWLWKPGAARWQKVTRGPPATPNLRQGVPLGSRLLFVGDDGSPSWLFEPAPNRWRKFSWPKGLRTPRIEAVGPDTLAFFPTDEDGLTHFAEGWLYQVKRAQWRRLSPRGAPSPRATFTVTDCEGRTVIWGGESVARDSPDGPVRSVHLGDGFLLDEKKGEWQPMTAIGAPSPRALAFAACHQGRIVIYGGYGPASQSEAPLLSDGGIYSLGSAEWSPLQPANAPEFHSNEWASKFGLSVVGSRLVHVEWLRPDTHPAWMLELGKASWERLPSFPKEEEPPERETPPGLLDEGTRPQRDLGGVSLSDAMILNDHQLLSDTLGAEPSAPTVAVLNLEARRWCVVSLPQPPAGIPLNASGEVPADLQPDSQFEMGGASYLFRGTLGLPRTLALWGSTQMPQQPPCYDAGGGMNPDSPCVHYNLEPSYGTGGWWVRW